VSLSGQETFTKTLLQQKQRGIKQGIESRSLMLMKKKTSARLFTGIVVLFLVEILFASSVNANFTPLPELPTPLYIRGDGTVEGGAEALQRTGNVYTFTDNIYNEIVVERDDIVLDGADYALQGSDDGTGIYAINKSSVEVKNVHISAFKFGIYLYGSKNSLLSENNLTNNNEYGIYLLRSDNNSIHANCVETSGTGIQLAESSNNTVFQNMITANGEGIGFGSGGTNNTVYQNLIAENGYAFTFWASSHNTLYKNTVSNNTNQVHTWLSSNNWDYDSRGNYWSNYNGTDSDGDGIGDTPYTIATSPENYGDADNYPLMEPVEIPEFPSWTPLIFLFVASAVVLTIYKRKLCKHETWRV
jgi:parallel beta-helix repeat protein